MAVGRGRNQPGCLESRRLTGQWANTLTYSILLAAHTHTHTQQKWANTHSHTQPQSFQLHIAHLLTVLVYVQIGQAGWVELVWAPDQIRRTVKLHVYTMQVLILAHSNHFFGFCTENFAVTSMCQKFLQNLFKLHIPWTFLLKRGTCLWNG